MAVSSSHCAGITFGVGAHHSPLACDIQQVGTREWLDILGTERHSLSNWLAINSGLSSDECSTRIWCVVECLKKSGHQANSSINYVQSTADGWVQFSARGLCLLSWCGLINGFRSPVVVAVASPRLSMGEQAIGTKKQTMAPALTIEA